MDISLNEMLSRITDILEKIPKKCKNTPLEDECRDHYGMLCWIVSDIHEDAYSCKIDSLVFDTIRFGWVASKLITELKSKGLTDIADSIESEMIIPAEYYTIKDVVKILKNRCNLKPPPK
jgi:hypothetical protein